jgi:hypothetical protein
MGVVEIGGHSNKSGLYCLKSKEPWIASLEDFVNAGGKLADLKKQISDAGLTVERGIGNKMHSRSPKRVWRR